MLVARIENESRVPECSSLKHKGGKAYENTTKESPEEPQVKQTALLASLNLDRAGLTGRRKTYKEGAKIDPGRGGAGLSPFFVLCWLMP